MYVDLGNVIEATPGVSREALERLDERVGRAHERIEAGRAADEHGYAALNLPENADPTAVRAAVEPFGDPAAVLTVGIGGSALGAATIADALENDNGERRSTDRPSGRGEARTASKSERRSREQSPRGDVEAYFLDNVDPDHTAALLDSLPLEETVVNVVSQSGTTAETLANFLVVREAMDDAGVDWTERTLVTTGEAGNLRRLAETHDLPALNVPDGVPGRFSALSTVGMTVAEIQGRDLDALLDGAADEADRLAGSLFESPAYAYGAASYALARRGAAMNAMMPYAESLDRFSEWFAQLWAESLGKDGLGQTPLRALGATDQHSQLQLYRAGPRDKLVTLVRPRERDDVSIPETDLDGLAYLGGSSLGELLDAEFEATEASLAAAGVPNVRIEIDRVDERSLGGLLYGMEAACVLYGELAGVEAFTQPAVEWGKRAARGLLGGGDFEEAAAVDEKRRLGIGE